MSPEWPLSVSGSVSGLDGVAFTVSVDWGDGGDAEDFRFAAGATSFDVSHLYDTAVGTCPVTVTVTPTDQSDAREASAATSVNVYDPGPTVTMTGFPQDTGSPCSLVAAGYEWWNPDPPPNYYTYHWAAADVYISDQAEADFPADGGQISLDAAIQSGVGYLTVTDGFGSGTTTRVSANQWYAVPSAVPPGPTVSIQETDTGGMVFEGDAANFDIHVDAGTSEPTSPLTVDYRTMDGSGVAPTDYQSTNGPVQVTFQPGDFSYDQASGDWIADKTFSIGTTGGIDGGGDKQFSVELSQP